MSSRSARASAAAMRVAAGKARRRSRSSRRRTCRSVCELTRCASWPRKMSPPWRCVRNDLEPGVQVGTRGGLRASRSRRTCTPGCQCVPVVVIKGQGECLHTPSRTAENMASITRDAGCRCPLVGARSALRREQRVQLAVGFVEQLECGIVAAAALPFSGVATSCSEIREVSGNARPPARASSATAIR